MCLMTYAVLLQKRKYFIYFIIHTTKVVINFVTLRVMSNGQTIWDPLRRKEVALTPEEAGVDAVVVSALDVRGWAVA